MIPSQGVKITLCLVEKLLQRRFFSDSYSIDVAFLTKYLDMW